MPACARLWRGRNCIASDACERGWAPPRLLRFICNDERGRVRRRVRAGRLSPYEWQRSAERREGGAQTIRSRRRRHARGRRAPITSRSGREGRPRREPDAKAAIGPPCPIAPIPDAAGLGLPVHGVYDRRGVQARIERARRPSEGRCAVIVRRLRLQSASPPADFGPFPRQRPATRNRADVAERRLGHCRQNPASGSPRVNLARA